MLLILQKQLLTPRQAARNSFRLNKVDSGGGNTNFIAIDGIVCRGRVIAVIIAMWEMES